MREPTQEERKGVNGYIKSISKSTGVNFFDYLTCKDCKNFRDIDGGECFFACGAVPADCKVNVVCEDKFESIN